MCSDAEIYHKAVNIKRIKTSAGAFTMLRRHINCRKGNQNG
jgi:F0F1-type ATP synthase epsilon subunit